jgi:RNA polymerase sigma-70 factor (ECF subfamily)
MEKEESLVDRARQRDPEAFGLLYEQHFDRIYRYLAFKTGDRTEAEDLTQQVFFKAWDAIGSYKPKGLPFSSWLFRIAHNQLVDYLRKRSRKELPLDEAEAPPSADPLSLVEHKMRLEELADACRHLTEPQQEVISLRFAAGLSTAEVAKAMNKSEAAVKSIQHSALVALRRILSPEWREQGGDI